MKRQKLVKEKSISKQKLVNDNPQTLTEIFFLEQARQNLTGKVLDDVGFDIIATLASVYHKEINHIVAQNLFRKINESRKCCG